MHALRGRHTSKEALASEAIHVEQCMLQEPVGLQDQISAAFGGFNHIAFRPDGTYEVTPMILPRERLAALQDHLLLVFTGISRLAPDVAQTVIDNLKQQDRRAAGDAGDGRSRRSSILASPTADIVEFGRLLERVVDAQAPAVRPRLERGRRRAVRDRARAPARSAASCSAPAAAGSCCCSSGPRTARACADALRNLIAVPFKFETSGCRIVLYQPDGL